MSLLLACLRASRTPCSLGSTYQFIPHSHAAAVAAHLAERGRVMRPKDKEELEELSKHSEDAHLLVEGLSETDTEAAEELEHMWAFIPDEHLPFPGLQGDPLPPELSASSNSQEVVMYVRRAANWAFCAYLYDECQGDKERAAANAAASYSIRCEATTWATLHVTRLPCFLTWSPLASCTNQLQSACRYALLKRFLRDRNLFLPPLSLRLQSEDDARTLLLTLANLNVEVLKKRDLSDTKFGFVVKRHAPADNSDFNCYTMDIFPCSVGENVHAQLPDLSKALHVSKVSGAVGIKEVARWPELRRAATKPKLLVAGVGDEGDLAALMQAVAGVCERVRARRHILSVNGLAEVDLIAVPLPTSAQEQAAQGVQGAPDAPLVVALAWIRRVPHQRRWNRVCRQLPMAPIEITASNGWTVLSGLPDLMIATFSRNHAPDQANPGLLFSRSLLQAHSLLRMALSAYPINQEGRGPYLDALQYTVNIFDEEPHMEPLDTHGLPELAERPQSLGKFCPKTALLRALDEVQAAHDTVDHLGDSTMWELD